MGLKSLIIVAPGNFGTSVKIVAFAVAGRKLVAKKFLIDVVTSKPIKSQVVLKKADVSPSGPGALLGLSLKKIVLISSAIVDREKRVFRPYKKKTLCKALISYGYNTIPY